MACELNNVPLTYDVSEDKYFVYLRPHSQNRLPSRSPSREDSKRMMRLLLLAVAGLSVGCSGAGDGGSVRRTVADGWSTKWCQAAPGNAKEQLSGIMGPATSTTDTTLMWAAYEYQFNAFLDPDGTVRQLDVNTHSLSDAQQAAVTCEKIRTKAAMARAAKNAAARPSRPEPT